MPVDSENIDTASDFSIQPVSSDDLPFPLGQSVEVRDKKYLVHLVQLHGHVSSKGC